MGLIRSAYPRVRSYRRNGHTYYDVDCRKRGWNGPPRLSFSDKAAALAKARHIASTVGDHLHHALTTASSSPHPTPSITTTEWDEQLAVHGKTVRDAVVQYLHQLVARSDGGHSVSEAALRWAEYVRTDTKKRNRPRTIQEIGAYAIQFGHLFPDTPLTRLNRRMVDRVIVGLTRKNGEPVSSQTRRNVLTKLKQFLNWCVGEQLLPTNPASSLSVSVEASVPEAYTVDQVMEVLRMTNVEAHQSVRSYVVLGLFAGLRPTEAQRLTWNEVMLDQELLSILPDRTKVKRARLVRLNPTVMAWLRLCDPHQPLIPVGFDRRFRTFQRCLRFPWIPDGLRHTFATYHLSVHQNRAQLAEHMGNSVSVLGRHYVRPVRLVEAERFWRLLPNTF